MELIFFFLLKSIKKLFHFHKARRYSEVLHHFQSDMFVLGLQVTECEIFLSLLVKFLDGEKPQWLRAVAVESVHRLCVQPHLLR